MKKTLIIISVLLLLSVILNTYLIFRLCNNNEKNYLEGNYSDVLFYIDGTMVYHGFRGTYTYSSKMKTVSFSFSRNNREETYTSIVDENNKTLPDFEDIYSNRNKELIQLEAFLRSDLSNERIEEIGEVIQAIDGINSIKYNSKEDAERELNQRHQTNPNLIDSITIVKASYSITLTNSNAVDDIKSQITKVDGIESVNIIKIQL
ncbi:MAG: permease-like cell division protein FtsX [Clostridia bacterium]|nr:permease-like cell division protein FtsX [Clostridia bacterium]